VDLIIGKCELPGFGAGAARSLQIIFSSSVMSCSAASSALA
jgi:hypothetical protein